MNLLEEKLGSNIDLQTISQFLCKEYKLGDYKEYKYIEIGIEDLNYCLITSQKKYFIKLFNKEREEEEATNYIEKYNLLQICKIQCPKLIESKIIKKKIGSTEVSLIIMEHLDGKDLYSWQESITIMQTNELMRIMKEVHNISSKSKGIYDEYHVNHFEETYDKCISYMNEEWKILGEKLKEKYKKIDFSKMPKVFIHGDLHKGNIFKDLLGKIYLIDFSSCGYSYRIIDIVEFINNTLFDYREIKESKQRIKYFLENYELTKYEKVNIEILCQCYAFISIALKQYDFHHGINQREESQYWIENNNTILKGEILEII